MLSAYRNQDWDKARQALTRSRQYDAEFGLKDYHDLIEERLDTFEVRSPGANWDGVHVATTK